MSNYQRSTRLCSPSQLQPALLRALQAYFQAHELGDLETECLKCCETVSEKKSTSWLSSWLEANAENTIHSAIMLTARHLIWARSADQKEAFAVGADLAFINAGPHVALFTKDIGLQVAGFVGGSNRNIRGVIALGSEPAAIEFCEEVKEAIKRINPEKARKWPKWMGGS